MTPNFFTALCNLSHIKKSILRYSTEFNLQALSISTLFLRHEQNATHECAIGCMTVFLPFWPHIPYQESRSNGSKMTRNLWESFVLGSAFYGQLSGIIHQMSGWQLHRNLSHSAGSSTDQLMMTIANKKTNQYAQCNRIHCIVNAQRVVFKSVSLLILFSSYQKL